jgi:RNA-directed DNA polymerase
VEMSKHAVWRAEQHVKATPGAAGGDAESIPACEGNRKDNLSKSWNRLAAGSDVPPPVRAVGIPTQTGGTRRLGLPTVGDSSAQMVATESLEPVVEPQCPPDASG